MIQLFLDFHDGVFGTESFFTQPRDVFARRTFEEAAVFPAELRGAQVADASARVAGVETSVAPVVAKAKRVVKKAVRRAKARA